MNVKKVKDWFTDIQFWVNFNFFDEALHYVQPSRSIEIWVWYVCEKNIPRGTTPFKIPSWKPD